MILVVNLPQVLRALFSFCYCQLFSMILLNREKIRSKICRCTCVHTCKSPRLEDFLRKLARDHFIQRWKHLSAVYLHSNPASYWSLYEIPASVANQIVQLMRDLLLEGRHEGKTMF